MGGGSLWKGGESDGDSPPPPSTESQVGSGDERLSAASDSHHNSDADDSSLNSPFQSTSAVLGANSDEQKDQAARRRQEICQKREALDRLHRRRELRERDVENQFLTGPPRPVMMLDSLLQKTESPIDAEASSGPKELELEAEADAKIESPASSDVKIGKVRAVRAACYDCRMRKIRCDGTSPACSLCVKSGLKCKYPQPQRVRSTPKIQELGRCTFTPRLPRAMSRIDSEITEVSPSTSSSHSGNGKSPQGDSWPDAMDAMDAEERGRILDRVAKKEFRQMLKTRVDQAEEHTQRPGEGLPHGTRSKSSSDRLCVSESTKNLGKLSLNMSPSYLLGDADPQPSSPNVEEEVSSPSRTIEEVAPSSSAVHDRGGNSRSIESPFKDPTLIMADSSSPISSEPSKDSTLKSESVSDDSETRELETKQELLESMMANFHEILPGLLNEFRARQQAQRKVKKTIGWFRGDTNTGYQIGLPPPPPSYGPRFSGIVFHAVAPPSSPPGSLAQQSAGIALPISSCSRLAARLPNRLPAPQDTGSPAPMHYQQAQRQMNHYETRTSSAQVSPYTAELLPLSMNDGTALSCQASTMSYASGETERRERRRISSDESPIQKGEDEEYAPHVASIAAHSPLPNVTMQPTPDYSCFSCPEPSVESESSTFQFPSAHQTSNELRQPSEQEPKLAGNSQKRYRRTARYKRAPVATTIARDGWKLVKKLTAVGKKPLITTEKSSASSEFKHGKANDFPEIPGETFRKVAVLQAAHSPVQSLGTGGNRDQCGQPQDTVGSSEQSTQPARKVRKTSKPLHRANRGNEEDPSDDEDDSSIRRPRQPKKIPGDSIEERRKLACPFYKKNPRKYANGQACTGPGWDTTHRLKEHLYRKHTLPPYCPRCQLEFQSTSQVDSHLLSDPPCQVQVAQLRDGVTPKQEKLLRSRKRNDNAQTETEKWRKIYLILFPETDPKAIPSPFYDIGPPPVQALGADGQDGGDGGNCGGKSLDEYEEFLKQELPLRVRQELERRIDDAVAVGPVDERMKTELVDIVQKIQLSLLNSFREGRASPLSAQTSRQFEGGGPSTNAMDDGKDAFFLINNFVSTSHPPQPSDSNGSSERSRSLYSSSTPTPTPPTQGSTPASPAPNAASDMPDPMIGSTVGSTPGSSPWTQDVLSPADFDKLSQQYSDPAAAMQGYSSYWGETDPNPLVGMNMNCDQFAMPSWAAAASSYTDSGLAGSSLDAVGAGISGKPGVGYDCDSGERPWVGQGQQLVLGP